MAFFKLKRTEAEKAQERTLKELEREAKTQRKQAAKEHKAQQQEVKLQRKIAKRREKQAQNEAKQADKAIRKSHRQTAKYVKKASKACMREARKAEKERKRLERRQMRMEQRNSTAVAAGGVAVPPFSKSANCYVCGKKFGQMVHRRRHHCRQCRESCCLQCTSRTRQAVPQHGLSKPQKVCVVCETMGSNAQDVASSSQPREPAEVVRALASSGRASRRPRSAPVSRPTGVTVPMPQSTRGPTRSRSSSIWKLPIRPLLKRKKSAEQSRNRKLDLDLQVEKQAIFGGRTIELQPQVMASTLREEG